MSCDTFVALPDSASAAGPEAPVPAVVFGKNSDRPKGEVQEVGDRSKLGVRFIPHSADVKKIWDLDNRTIGFFSDSITPAREWMINGIGH